VDHQRMGIQVELRVGDKRVRRLVDPAGGFFDSAGDFDRLLCRGSPALRLFNGVDPHGETRFDMSQMQQLVVEVELLLAQATPGAEERGLIQLRAMAERCAEEGGELVFDGD
jgi:hypothetical protein